MRINEVWLYICYMYYVVFVADWPIGVFVCSGGKDRIFFFGGGGGSTGLAC